eukprot:7610006-Karenia_brevis.AAC.1
MNSVIKRILEMCRNISQALLSSRCILRKALSLGARGAPLKWSNVKPRAKTIVDSALSGYGT